MNKRKIPTHLREEFLIFLLDIAKHLNKRQDKKNNRNMDKTLDQVS